MCSAGGPGGSWADAAHRWREPVCRQSLAFLNTSFSNFWDLFCCCLHRGWRGCYILLGIEKDRRSPPPHKCRHGRIWFTLVTFAENDLIVKPLSFREILPVSAMCCKERIQQFDDGGSDEEDIWRKSILCLHQNPRDDQGGAHSLVTVVSNQCMRHDTSASPHKHIWPRDHMSWSERPLLTGGRVGTTPCLWKTSLWVTWVRAPSTGCVWTAGTQPLGMGKGCWGSLSYGAWGVFPGWS